MRNVRRGFLASVLLACAGAWLLLRWLEHSWEPPYSLIEDGLYVGASVPQPPPGTTAVLNLCGREDPYQVDKRLWEPILEGQEEPGLDWLRRMVAFVDTQRRAGATTYVHCLAGMNRSATVVTAYLMSEHRWSRDRALAFVRSKHPQAQPNPSLLRLLLEWEKALSKVDPIV